jgi:uncharacterized membrane protein YfhO
MNADPSSEIRSLAAGVRAVAGILVLILSYFNLSPLLKVAEFQMIYADMFGGKPLPLLTEFVIRGLPLWLALAVLLPVLACGALFTVRDHRRALFIAAGSMLLIGIQIILTCAGLFAPLMTIISDLTSGAG